MPPPVEHDWKPGAEDDEDAPRRRRRRRVEDDYDDHDDYDDYDPRPRRRPASKSRLAYILLALFFGYLGVHNFYADRTGPGVAQLILCLVSAALLCVLVGIAGFVVLVIWNIVEIITVREDGRGVPME